jgi:hypothetical protein
MKKLNAMLTLLIAQTFTVTQAGLSAAAHLIGTIKGVTH